MVGAGSPKHFAVGRRRAGLAAVVVLGAQLGRRGSLQPEPAARPRIAPGPKMAAIVSLFMWAVAHLGANASAVSSQPCRLS